MMFELKSKKHLHELTEEDIYSIKESYTIAKIESNKEFSLLRTGTVSAKNLLTGEYVSVSKEEFYSDTNLVGSMNGRFTGDNNVSKRKEVRQQISLKKKNQVTVSLIEDKSNKRFCIDLNEFDFRIHKKFNPNENRDFDLILSKNKFGEKQWLNRNDSKLLSGEWVHFNKQDFKTYKLLKDDKCFTFLTLRKVVEFCKENDLSYKRLIRQINTKIVIDKSSRHNKVNNCDGWTLLESNELI